MKYFDWSEEKNQKLIKDRKISFEIIVACIKDGHVLDLVEHPNANKYPNQFMYIVEFDDYVYVVPFVEDNVKIFLKTIIPNRKLTRKYFNK